jgi:hypothetical protein
MTFLQGLVTAINKGTSQAQNRRGPPASPISTTATLLRQSVVVSALIEDAMTACKAHRHGKKGSITSGKRHTGNRVP